MTIKRFDEAEWLAVRDEVAAIKLRPEQFFDYVMRPTTQEALVEKYGVDWTLQDALASVQPLLSPGAGRKARKGKLVAEVATEPVDFEAEIQKRMAETLRDAVDVQPRDLALVRQLVAHEIQSERMLARLAATEDTDEIVALTNALERTRKSIVDLQKTLGIDRLTRRKQAEVMSDAEKVLAELAAAGQWVFDGADKIVHCDTLVAWVVNNFRGHTAWRAEFTCPKCFQVFAVEYTPSAAAVAQEQEPAWVAEEEASYDTGGVVIEPETESE